MNLVIFLISPQNSTNAGTLLR